MDKINILEKSLKINYDNYKKLENELNELKNELKRKFENDDSDFQFNESRHDNKKIKFNISEELLSELDEIHIINRRNEIVPINFNKIFDRINLLINIEPKLRIKSDLVTQKTITRITNNITTYELDVLSSEICGSLITEHPDYDNLAARIRISNLHKETSDCLVETLNKVNSIKVNRKKLLLVNTKTIKCAEFYKKEINKVINYEKDYLFPYLGIMTLMQSYLLKDLTKDKNNIIERPQQLWMRVAIGLHLKYLKNTGELNPKYGYTFKNISKLYNYLSNGYYTHATPTLFNAGLNYAALSSCFLLEVPDNLEGIYTTLLKTALISKRSGGIGVHISQVRAKNTIIIGTNGKSDGIIPMLKVYNDTGIYVTQGGGKRKGSIATYLEPWHAEIEDFLKMKEPIGEENLKCRDLFIALWIPNLFMERLIQAVENQNNNNDKIIYWSLMCPDKCFGLPDVYGEEFDKLYIEYENKKMYNKQIDIFELANKIVEVMQEAGQPYIMFKDFVNQKCNQNNLGTIKSSNLCSEILIYTDKNNVGVCNLASVVLSKFVENKKFNYKKLFDVVYDMTINLNKVIDNNVYPVKEGQNSDYNNRPIGIGCQGLATTFMLLKLSFTSDEAKRINKYIFETMYFAALTSSNDLAKKHGPYKTYKTSMVAQGKLQFDLWGVTPESNLWNWDELRQKIKTYGIYNSLLLALMPTASSSNINDNTACFEPITSNIYKKNLLSGEFQKVNKLLINDLIELNLWNKKMKELIIAHKGSIQNIDEIPNNLKDIYKTVWEYKLKDLIDMDADRGVFICQSSSSNRFMIEPSNNKLIKMLIYCYKKKLKTASYYIRTKPSTEAIQFNIDPNTLEHVKQKKKEIILNNQTCSNEDDCLTCSA